jgi:hypothetical protein
MVSGDDGLAHTRGFLGEYEITVTVGDVSTTIPATLIKDGTAVSVVWDPQPAPGF